MPLLIPTVTEALEPLQFGALPQVTKAPDGSNCHINVYPANQYGKGFNFYTEGDKSGVSITGAHEVVFTYSVWFDAGFDYVLGGKLPGLYGGSSLEQAKTCSGGRQDNRDQCFSARVMWRPNGEGEVYNYYPPSAQQGNNYCNTPPKSVCNPSYGDSIGRGSFTFSAGQWNVVSHRVKLNDVGQSNGEQEIVLNGQSKLKLTGLQQRVNGQVTFYGIMADTFFGGSGNQYAPPTAQTAYFKDYTLTVLS